MSCASASRRPPSSTRACSTTARSSRRAPSLDCTPACVGSGHVRTERLPPLVGSLETAKGSRCTTLHKLTPVVCHLAREATRHNGRARAGGGGARQAHGPRRAAEEAGQEAAPPHRLRGRRVHHAPRHQRRGVRARARPHAHARRQYGVCARRRGERADAWRRGRRSGRRQGERLRFSSSRSENGREGGRG